MPGGIHQYLADDHARLNDALTRATRDPRSIDASAYAEFREGLLRHIAIEEKILLPAAARAGQPVSVAAKLRLDHGALAALLVPTPTESIIRAIRIVLEAHNPIEEKVGGVYDECEQILGTTADEVLKRIHDAPRVAVAKHVDNPAAMESARGALRRAGYNIEV